MIKHSEVIATLREPARYYFDGSEREFESYVVDALPEIFEHLGIAPIDKLKRQMVLRGADYWVRLDILVRHTDRTLSVLEVKCLNQKHPQTATHEQAQGVGQLLEYASLVHGWSGVWPRLFLVDTKIHLRTVMLIQEWGLPIVPIEIQNDRVFVPVLRGEAGAKALEEAATVHP